MTTKGRGQQGATAADLLSLNALRLLCRIPDRLPGTDDPSSILSRPAYTHPAVNLVFVSTSIMSTHRSTYSNLETDGPYQNGAYSNSQWLEKQQSGNRKSKFIVSLHI